MPGRAEDRRDDPIPIRLRQVDNDLDKHDGLLAALSERLEKHARAMDDKIDEFKSWFYRWLLVAMGGLIVTLLIQLFLTIQRSSPSP
jgi:hypothetical protein